MCKQEVNVYEFPQRRLPVMLMLVESGAGGGLRTIIYHKSHWKGGGGGQV